MTYIKTERGHYNKDDEKMKNIETYGAMKSRHMQEANAFKGIFFAFNNEQFETGMQSVGLTIKDTKAVCAIGAGGYLRQDCVPAFKNMIDRQSAEQKQRQQDENFLLESLVYELQNTEYCVSYDIEPALNALGLEESDIDKKLLKKACALAVKQ